MKVGVALRARYEEMERVAVAADQLGYESIWIPDHLMLPASIGAHAPIEGSTHPPIDPTMPTMDNMIVLAGLGRATTRVRLGTWVYNLALRHPFVSSRAAQTVDLLSGGRLEFGVGAGWIPGEYAAAGVDFATRGQRLDECITILRRLWTEETPAHQGRFFDFEPVRFEPKPVQQPIPIHVGGDSDAALRRVVRLGDGWVGSYHSVQSATERVNRLRELAAEAGRRFEEIEVTVTATPSSAEELDGFAAAGVDRLLVSPWRRTAEAVDGLGGYAAQPFVRRWLEEG